MVGRVWYRLTAVGFAANGNGDPTMEYLYSYNQAGRVMAQRLRVNADTTPVNWDAAYAWNNEGGMTSVSYPGSGSQWAGQDVYGYSYDAMGRPSAITTLACPPGGDLPGCVSMTTVASASYNTIGQLAGLTYDGVNETRTYNSLQQLASMTALQGTAVLMGMTYNYPVGLNNGRVSSTSDSVANETVSYTYDALNRLSTANAGSWSQSYSYDGFGNLTGANGAQVYNVDPATNRSAYYNYDANGLPTSSPAWAPTKSYQWDVENRMTFDGWNTYTYDPQGKRVRKVTPPAVDGQWPQTEIYFYGVGGQKLATIQCHPDENGHGFYCGSPGNNLYFVGKLIRSKGVTVATDRLGSVRANASGERMRYAPYGQELTSTADGRELRDVYAGCAGPGLCGSAVLRPDGTVLVTGPGGD